MAAPAAAGRIEVHRSEADRWEMAYGVPHEALRGVVKAYCSYEENTSSFTRRIELPSDSVALIVNLGDPISVMAPGGTQGWTSQARGFVAGLHHTFALTETDGSQRGVQVNLTAVGAHRLLGTPMHELTGWVIELEDVLGPAAVVLRDQLAEAPGHAARFDVLDRYLRRRLAGSVRPSPGVLWALSRLNQSAGRASVAQLTQEIGCSSRYLTSRFREEVGLPPKLLARILRFGHAVELVDRGAVRDGWAAIATEAGYYDQAHLIRDFRQFAGVSPGDFVRRRLPDGGGVVGH